MHSEGCSTRSVTFLLQDNLGTKIVNIRETFWGGGGPRKDRTRGSEGVAGREGGGGDIGKSHSNSEEEQTTSYGRPNTNGFRAPKIMIMLRHYLYIATCG